MAQVLSIKNVLIYLNQPRMHEASHRKRTKEEALQWNLTHMVKLGCPNVHINITYHEILHIKQTIYAVDTIFMLAETPESMNQSNIRFLYILHVYFFHRNGKQVILQVRSGNIALKKWNTGGCNKESKS